MGRIKQIINNLSIKKAFMLYMLLFLILAATLSSLSINLADHIKNGINLSYTTEENQYKLSNGTNMVYIASTPIKYSPRDKVIIKILGFIDIWSIPLWFGLCIVLSALLFYRNKLKKPIELLNHASKMIAENDLNFTLNYKSKDEMGQLCSSFEAMRAALEKNNYEMWSLLEERKRLNASFSHDLRTPLTVLRGYADFLTNYTPQGKVSEEKLMSTISTMQNQISRLENYVQMMSEVQKLEDITVNAERVTSSSLTSQLKEFAYALTTNTKLSVEFINELPDQELYLDSAIVQRVYENLVSNALQYAKSKISIYCENPEGNLSISVSDDGSGFTLEGLKQADKPYYRSNPNPSDTHWGLGLTICRVLCEKHNGKLVIENGSNGGAKVTSIFGKLI